MFEMQVMKRIFKKRRAFCSTSDVSDFFKCSVLCLKNLDELRIEVGEIHEFFQCSQTCGFLPFKCFRLEVLTAAACSNSQH